jgi:glucosylceramidase
VSATLAKPLLRASLAALIALAWAGSVAGCGPSSGAVQVVQTSFDLRQRLSRLSDVSFVAQAPRGAPVVHVDDGARYQRVLGAGIALTDSAAWLIGDQLPARARNKVLSDLFGPRGIQLRSVRVPIGATDFTKDGRPYSYDDLPPGRTDPTLSHFSIRHDLAYVIPTLRRIAALNPSARILASTWSPPGWMKANGELGNQGNRGSLVPAGYAWMARYIVRFVQEYARAGVLVDAVTAQNEPGQQTSYPGLNLPLPEQAKFISGYLGPALHAAGLDVKIYAHDFKWLFAPDVLTLISNRAVRAALGGVAWHCYNGNPQVMTMVHRIAPELDQVESECATGGAPGPPAELLIASFRNWATQAILWSVALDRSSGPVQPPNQGCPYCKPVVTVDEHSHTAVYQPDYYQLGQFGRFVSPGAQRIGSEHFVSYNSPTRYHKVPYSTPGLDDVAFVNPDGTKVLLAHNTSTQPYRFAVAWRGRSFTYTLPAGATATFRWR